MKPMILTATVLAGLLAAGTAFGQTGGSGAGSSPPAPIVPPGTSDTIPTPAPSLPGTAGPTSPGTTNTLPDPATPMPGETIPGDTTTPPLLPDTTPTVPATPGQ